MGIFFYLFLIYIHWWRRISQTKHIIRFQNLQSEIKNDIIKDKASIKYKIYITFIHAIQVAF